MRKSVTKVIRIFRRSRRSYVSIVLRKPTRAFWETVSHCQYLRKVWTVCMLILLQECHISKSATYSLNLLEKERHILDYASVLYKKVSVHIIFVL